MISQEQLLRIYAKRLMQSKPGMSETEAVDEVQQELFSDPGVWSALLAITEAVWQDGFESRTLRRISMEQRCRLANEFLNEPANAVMRIIERTEQAILEAQHDTPK